MLAIPRPASSRASANPQGMTRVVLSAVRRLIPLRRPRVLRGRRLPKPAVAPIVTTERLTLRPHRMDDVEAWYRLQSDPHVIRYLDWPRRTRAQSRTHLSHRTRHVKLLQRDDFLALAIEHEGELVGDVSLHLRDVSATARSVEAGWILDPAHGGQGLATEAAGALITFAFERLAATCVTATIVEGNARSVALAERLGFQGPPEHMRLTRERFDRRPALAYLTSGTARVTR